MKDYINDICMKSLNIETLYEQQIKIIKLLLNCKNIIANLSIGYGKSICYQLFHKLRKKTIIYIAPLISLIKDQKSRFDSLEIKSFELSKSKKNLKKNVIYLTTPERLIKFDLDILKKFDNDILIIIDEAHCISMWGKDFRTSYTKLFKKLYLFFNFQYLILSASMNEQIISEIQEIIPIKFEIINQIDIKENINIHRIDIQKNDDKIPLIKNLLDRNHNKKSFVYVNTINQAELLFQILKKNYDNCYIFHGKISDKTIINRFKEDKKTIVICTSALSMGVNLFDFNLLIFYDLPYNSQILIQMIGRIGRNNNKSNVYIIENKENLNIAKTIITKTSIKKSDLTKCKEKAQYQNSLNWKKLVMNVGFDEKKLSKIYKNKDIDLKQDCYQNKLKELVKVYGILDTKKCLWNYIISLFENPQLEKCSNCSNCNNNLESLDRYYQISDIDNDYKQASYKIKKNKYHQGGYSLVLSNHRIANMLSKLKYSDETENLYLITEALISFLDVNCNFIKDVNHIIPIPTRNQNCENIWKIITSRYNLFYKKLLKYNRNNYQQKLMRNVIKKKVNIKDAFMYEDEMLSISKKDDQTVLLVDDIYDTGCSINEAAKVLSENGLRKIKILTISKTYYSV